MGILNRFQKKSSDKEALKKVVPNACRYKVVKDEEGNLHHTIVEICGYDKRGGIYSITGPSTKRYTVDLRGKKYKHIKKEIRARLRKEGLTNIIKIFGT